MQFVLAGASGLIGSALAGSLRADGHRVTQLVRRPATGPDTARWDPARGELDPGALTGADAVVCLSGVNVGDRRWNEDFKREILDSRVDSVGTIARTLAGVPEAERSPTLIAASAVGYYGDTGAREVDEDSPAGDSFLANVCVQWEAAAEPARAAGVRVVHLRTGLVLAAEGDLLKRLVPLVKAGVAGRLGSGRQYYPWISITDEVGAIRFLLEHDLAGPVNLTGPAPVTNAEFTRSLGRVLHRPTVLPVPRFAARTVLGEFAAEVLGGQQAMPRRLLDAGFVFRHRTVDEALRSELG
ncbi:MAG: uncharacterized protein QOI15_2900 [Pseudonocardiales bacterium]|nr:uncharacterized protein [Pseudonocardiales bacterium]